MSLQAIFDPMVMAYYKNKSGGGGGDRGEIIGYEYSVILPDINTVWTDEVKRILPYAFIKRLSERVTLYMADRPICMRNNVFYSEHDMIGIGSGLNIKTNTWDDDILNRVNEWNSPDDIGEYLAYAGEYICSDSEYVIWSSVDVVDKRDHMEYAPTIDFADPVAVYADGTGEESGGESGGTIVNPDKSGVLKFDFNSRVENQGKNTTNYIFFKLADEPFRVDPDVPITIDRIGTTMLRTNPFADVRTYQSGIENCSGQITPITTPDWITENDGFSALCAPTDPTEWGYNYDFIVRVTADSVVHYGVTLTKGLYTMCGDYDMPYPETIEILAPQT